MPTAKEATRQAGDQDEGVTSQAGDANSEGGDEEDRLRPQRSRRGAVRRPKGGGNDGVRGTKGVGEATKRRKRRYRQATNVTLKQFSQHMRDIPHLSCLSATRDIVGSLTTLWVTRRSLAASSPRQH